MTLWSYIWIGVFILALIIEGATMQLVTVWFALGALAAYLISLVGAPVWLQVVVFIIATVLMLIFLFPLARKRLKVGQYKTNVDSLIGKDAVISEAITFNEIGAASVNGVIWSATGEGAYEVGERVTIIEVRGNRLIVKKSSGNKG